MTSIHSGLLVVILGPTASGKSAVTLKLAKHYKSIIVSADSRQFYKEMKIGTCRLTEEDTEGIQLYFSGNLSINEYYSAGRFESDVITFLNNQFKSNEIIFLSGGTGLYIDAVCDGIGDSPGIDMKIRKDILMWYETFGIEKLLEMLKSLDPVYYNQVDKHNTKRIIRALEVIEQTGLPYSQIRNKKNRVRDFEILKIGIEIPRDVLYERINERVDSMVKEGLIEEARNLYPNKNLTALKTVGYEELFSHFDGKLNLEESIRLIKRNTRRYAKRQLTWFKKDPRVHWINPSEFENMTGIIDGILKSC